MVNPKDGLSKMDAEFVEATIRLDAALDQMNQKICALQNLRNPDGKDLSIMRRLVREIESINERLSVKT